MKNKSLTLFDAGIAFVFSFILAQFTSAIGIIAVESFMQAFGQTEAQIIAFFDTATGYLLQAIFMNIAFILVFIWYAKRINKKDLLAKPSDDTKKYMVTCVIIGLLTLFLLSGALNYFQLLLDKIGYKTTSLGYELNTPSNYLISLISLAVIPAICEELIFRGILVNALKSKGEIFAIILSSVMFSIFHFSPAQLIYPICFGLILSIVYLRTKNILFPILLHFINNALSISIQYFSNSSGGTFSHSASNLIYAIITFAIWFLLIRHLFKDFKTHRETANKDNEENIAAEPHTNQSNNVKYSDKTNTTVLYGSIMLMMLVYIILLFV